MKLAEAPEASGAADKSKHLVKAIQTNTYHSTPKSIKKQLKKLYVKWVQKKIKIYRTNRFTESVQLRKLRNNTSVVLLLGHASQSGMMN